MPDDERDRVVVIGAGVAGLTAAATAARAGKPVLVLEAHAGGGRARTDVRNGYHFNQGAHALYQGGAAKPILRELGVRIRGHMPPLRGARCARGGEQARLFGAPLVSYFAKSLSASPSKWRGRNAAEWADSLGRSDGVSELARMFIRIATYVEDLEGLSAEFAISHLKMASRGVSYLDGGFASLVQGLSSAARAAGAIIRTHQPASGIRAVPGGWEVTLASGEALPASAVVIAAGGPAAARNLLPVDPDWPELGPPVTAACLDLGLRGHGPGLLFGVDEPLYLSRHCPPGNLAPSGASLVHVVRYGASDAMSDRCALRSHARLAGITDDHIVEERFLADMVVTHVLPGPERGLAGRPTVEVGGAEGMYLAGDWVGPRGWLTDAALVSGREAGRLAARPASVARTYPSVA